MKPTSTITSRYLEGMPKTQEHASWSDTNANSGRLENYCIDQQTIWEFLQKTPAQTPTPIFKFHKYLGGYGVQ